MQHAATSEALPVPPIEPSHDLPSDNHRRNGKVARLPKPIRDHINHMLEDGLTYAIIVEQLGPAGRGLTPDNISQWKKGGYQDWLRDHFWRVDMRFRQESFTDLLNAAEPIQLPEAGLQVAVTGICELLRDLCQNTNDRKNDSDKYVRVANSLARLSRSILQLQQYRDSVATDEAAKLKVLDHKRDFTGTEREGVLDCADNLFGFKSARRLQASEISNPEISNSHSPVADSPSQPSQISNSQPPAPDSPSQILNPEISDPRSPAPGGASQISNPEISNPQPLVPDSASQTSQISNPEVSNPRSPLADSPSQISNPEILNSQKPPPACTLCSLRPAPWPPNPLPHHCFICADRLALSQPP